MALVLPSQYPWNSKNPFGAQSSLNLVGTLRSDALGPLYSYFGSYVRPGYVLGHPHQGTDYLSPLGGDVFSIAPGQVMGWLYDSARGYHLLEWYKAQNNGQVVVCYQHLQNIKLEVVGSTVPAGHHIAESGASGIGTGPHLHVEVRFISQPAASRWNWQGWPAVSLRRILPGGDLASNPAFLPA